MLCPSRLCLLASVPLWLCLACGDSDRTAPGAQGLIGDPASEAPAKDPDNDAPHVLDGLGQRLSHPGLGQPAPPDREAMLLGGLEWLRGHSAEDASEFRAEFLALVVLLGLTPQEGPVRSTLVEMLSTKERRWEAEPNLQPRGTQAQLVFSCVRWMAQRRMGYEPQGELQWEGLLSSLESLDQSDAFLAAAICGSEMPEAGKARLERIRAASWRSPEWHRHRQQALQENQWYPFLHDLLSLSGLGSRPLQKVLTKTEWDAIDEDLRSGLRDLVDKRDAYHLDQLAELMVTRSVLTSVRGPLDEEAISAVMASWQPEGFFFGDPNLEPPIPRELLPSVRRHTTLLALWLLSVRSGDE